MGSANEPAVTAHRTARHRQDDRLAPLLRGLSIAPLRGFYTEEVRSGGVRQGFRLVTFGGERRLIADVRFGPPRVGKYGSRRRRPKSGCPESPMSEQEDRATRGLV